MEKSNEIFEKLLEDNRSKVDKVLTALNELYDAINGKDFDRAEQILLKAPALAGDSTEAHLHIAHRCHYVNQVEYAWFKRKRERLFLLAEQEFKLAEKLKFEGYMDGDTGKEVPKYIHYNMMAEIYVNWGKYDKAINCAQVAVELGMKSNIIAGEIYIAQEQYDKAGDFYLHVSKEELSPFDRQMVFNRLTCCYRRMKDKKNEIESLLKEYEHLLSHDELNESGFDPGEYEYNIAVFYAKNAEPINMLFYLEKNIRRNPQRIQAILREKNVFDPYKELPAFKKLIEQSCFDGV